MKITTKYNIGDMFFTRRLPGNSGPKVYIIDKIKIVARGPLQSPADLTPKFSYVYSLISPDNKNTIDAEFDDDGLDNVIKNKQLFTNIKEYKKAIMEDLKKTIDYFQNTKREYFKTKLTNVLHGKE